jgi:large subunit ribosomal protein L35
MPKMKTHRATAKRFSRTGSGLWKRAKGWKSHLLEHKTAKRKRRLRHSTIATSADRDKISRLLPYM